MSCSRWILLSLPNSSWLLLRAVMLVRSSLCISCEKNASPVDLFSAWGTSYRSFPHCHKMWIIRSTKRSRTFKKIPFIRWTSSWYSNQRPSLYWNVFEIKDVSFKVTAQLQLSTKMIQDGRVNVHHYGRPVNRKIRDWTRWNYLLGIVRSLILLVLFKIGGFWVVFILF